MKHSLVAGLVALCAATGFGAASDRVNVDAGWRFKLNKGEWRTVDLPHDWSIAFAPDLKWGTDKYNGFLPGGVGQYEKTFEVAEASTLCFEGAFRDVKVFVNDELKAKSYYGYLPFSVPLEPGENRVRVVVDNSAQPNSGNYTGSGINRHVWLAKRGREEPVRPSVKMPKVEWSAAKGLVVDGRPVKLHGGCVHENYGPLGSACWDEAALRMVRLLKNAGFNAVRQGHHPFSEAFLDACDREGLYVLADYFDVWFDPKQVFDYSRHFEEEWERDFRCAIRRDRRHPSILLWSVGNEVNLYTAEMLSEKRLRREVEQARKMVKVVREEDPWRRPTTLAMCAYGSLEMWRYQDPLAAEVDVVGYNYKEDLTEEDHERCPDRLIVYTEVQAKAAVTTWRKVNAHPYVIGEFVWAAMDYLGESTVGRWYYAEQEFPGEHYEAAPYFPWHGSTPGDIDITGWRRPISHYRETLWNPDAPTYMATREPSGWKGTIRTTGWASWPTWESWTYPGWEGKPITVEVCSRKPRVRLTLNGKVVGEKENGERNGYLVSFETPYEPGVLECDGVVLRTAGPVDRIRYSEETIGRLTWVTAEAVDKDGVFCPNAENEVTFEGNILGTCSADLRDLVPAPSRTRKMYRGRAQAVRLNSSAD